MNAYHALEWLIVGAAVAASLFAVARRLVPRLRGKQAVTTSGGCSSCDSCGSCATPPAAAKPGEQPVHWHASSR